jgi:hypothetical protein
MKLRGEPRKDADVGESPPRAPVDEIEEGPAHVDLLVPKAHAIASDRLDVEPRLVRIESVKVVRRRARRGDEDVVPLGEQVIEDDAASGHMTSADADNTIENAF